MSDVDQWPGDQLEEEEEEKKRRKGGVFLVLLACLLLLGAAGIVFTQWGAISNTLFPPANAQLDMRGNIVIPDDDAVVEDPTAKEDIGLGFTVVTKPDDKTILNVPLGEARQINGRIAPPGFKSVYWIKNLGVSLDKAEDGTFYTAAHSLRNGGWAPGNALINIEAGEATVHPGDLIYIGDCETLPAPGTTSKTCRTYSVTETRVIPKPQVGGAGELWDEKEPGRLIVFTCLQNPQNRPSTDNMIVIGTLVE